MCTVGEVDFLGFFWFFIMLHTKFKLLKEILRSNYKRAFSIFLALPMRKWLFSAQKSEKAKK
jgi:hypothetical protein